MNDPADSVDGFVDRGVYEARTRCSDLTVPHGESVVRDDERSEITEVRTRRRNVTLDWQGIDSETRQTLRTTRGGAKRGLTMALNRLSDALVTEGSIEEVTKCEKKLRKLSKISRWHAIRIGICWLRMTIWTNVQPTFEKQNHNSSQ